MLDCEFCHSNESAPLLTRCCKAFICPPCRDRLEKKLTCQCGRTLLPGKKSASEAPELYQVVKRFREGRRRECDRCDSRAELECLNCDMIFCGNCSNEVHAAAGFLKHERRKVSTEPNS
jgi:hypothetical protein